jgi:uncharacterized protein with NAD-binding domain and iron-sulfur cluster
VDAWAPGGEVATYRRGVGAPVFGGDVNRDRSIAVLGAGPAGLAAALYLEDAGYHRVTVLEAGDDVGGKCVGVEIDGFVHDLGAVLVSEAYEHTRRLIDRFGASLVRAPRFAAIDANTGARRFIDDFGALSPEDGARMREAALTWILALSANREAVGGAGYRNVPAELCRPFPEWARDNDASILVDLFVVFASCFGYGPLDRLPAATMMKNMARKSFVNLGSRDARWPALIAGGYQDLARRIAAALRDVRLGTRVLDVRRGERVEIVTTRGTETFDALLVAAPMDGTVPWLTDEERALFSQVRYVDYYATLARVDGLEPSVCFASILDGDRVVPPRDLVPCLFARRYAASDVAIFYTNAPSRVPCGDIERGVERLMQRVGGRVTSLLETRYFRYFPHVDGDAMAAGWHDRADALQGRNRTWWTGAMLDFELVEGAIGFSRWLVDRHFR